MRKILFITAQGDLDKKTDFIVLKTEFVCIKCSYFLKNTSVPILQSFGSSWKVCLYFAPKHNLSLIPPLHTLTQSLSSPFFLPKATSARSQLHTETNYISWWHLCAKNTMLCDACLPVTIEDTERCVHKNIWS